MPLPATLPDLLHAAARDTAQPLIVHVRADGSERSQSYGALRDEAERVSAGLRRAGLERGASVIVLAEQSEAFLPAFWGALLAGLVPVPLARDTDKLLAVAQFLDWPALVVDTEMAARLPNLPHGDVLHERSLSIDALLQTAPDGYRHHHDPDELAYLQFSSGSTGQPKGVELTHAQVVANIAQIIAATGINADDTSLSWMPFSHDMGLVCTHLVPLAARMKQVKMGPLHFLRRPAVWLDLAHRHQATILTAANFALMHVVKRLRPDQLTHLDLRAARILAVGAEPIVPRVCREFLDLMEPCGLARTALLPVYGLAEACVGATAPPTGTETIVHTVERAALVRDGRVLPAHPQAATVEITDLGFPLSGVELRIVDDDDRMVAAGTVGHIQLRGPNIMRRYHRIAPDDATFCDGWLRTGDQGFMLGDRLSVTGRTKDVIVVNGRKFHAHDLEDVVRQVPGVRPDAVAICGTQTTGDERVVVFVALENEWATDDGVGVLVDVARAVQRVLGHPVTDVLPLRSREFPRTTSGKLQRFKLWEQYQAGAWNELAQVVAAARAKLERDEQHDASEPYEADVRAIWARVLGRQPADLGRHDDFRSLGGSSLQAMDVLSELETLVGRTLEPAVLLTRPTIADLAAFLRTLPTTPHDDRMTTSARSVRRRPAPSVRDRKRETRATTEPLAVIGMACRFPDADTPEQFWNNLVAGVDSVRDVPSDRWSVERLYDPAPNTSEARSISRWGSFLHDPMRFDAAFFDIEGDEAVVIDPQHRVLLEVAYEALERAGYAGERRADKRIGVFVGIGESTYGEYLMRELAAGRAVHSSAAVGNLRNLAAARIARALSLTGPVMVVDTACSSSLVALHLARQSILAGECDLAVVGSVNLNLTATPYLLMSQAGALSPTGRCRAFDARADGFVPGEGAGALVVAALSDAERAHDRVLGLVRGTAVNNDGLSISPMAPNPPGQRAVLAQAYRDAAIAPESVSYIEAHGTGTPIGDPIEVRTLATAFPPLPDGALRPVGSVKTNVGHLLNAAGMPSLIKVLLQLQHREIAPSLHYDQPSPRFDLVAAGLDIPSTGRAWNGPLPLRAGINGFGFGGTNAHVIVEEAPRSRHVTPTANERPHLLMLSARTEAALRASVRALARYADDHPDVSVAELCFNASTARDGAEYRAAAVVQDDLVDVLAAIASGEQRAAITTGVVRRGHRPRIAFMFGGQGSLHAGDAHGLYRAEPSFATTLDEYAARIGPVGGRPLPDWCYGADAHDDGLAQTTVAQPLLVAMQIALARLLGAWGVQPDVVVGHSVGEIAAAAVAGALPTADALVLARTRGDLMGRLPGGAMAAVVASEATVRAAIVQHHSAVAIAAINGPREVVVAGTNVAVDALLDALHRDGITTKPLRVSHAFHSPQMEPMLEPFGAALHGLASLTPTTPFWSTVHGGALDRIDAAYWRDHAMQPVRFAATIRAMIEDGYDTFVEVGPGNGLTGMVRRIASEQGKPVTVLTLLRPGQDDMRSVYGALGRLWALGAPIKRAAMEPKHTQRRIPLPTYPFAHTRYALPAIEETVRPPEHNDERMKALFHAPMWIEEPLAAPVADHPRRWLLVGDRMGIAPHLRDVLRAAGATCEIVPTDAIRTRMAEGEPYGVVHLAGCDHPTTLHDVDALDQSQQRGVLDLLALAQHIEACPRAARPAGLWVVTSDVFATGHATEHPMPDRATIAGLAQALRDELPALDCRHIDVQAADGVAAMAAIIAGELRAPRPATGSPIAWRDGRRLVRTLRAVAPPDAPTLRPNGVYLITGGASGIGAAIARRLATTERPTLVLLARTPLADAPERAALLAELEAMGATVAYLEADIGDPDAVDAAITHVVRTHGPITGVVHAAGVVEPGLLHGKTADRFMAVLRPKVRGTCLLLEALRRHAQRPDFFVACSSLASVVPGLGGGLADYVAANAFLDAMGAAERAQGRPFTTLNWSVWAETGMGAHPALLEWMRERGYVPLRSDDGVEAFMRALGSPHAQLVIGERIEATTARHAPPMARTLHPQLTVVVADIHATSDTLHQTLQHLVGGALHVEATQVPIDEPFMALGLDSLAAVDLVKSLEQQTGSTLPLTLFFEHTTIRELATYLRSHVPTLRDGAAPTNDAPQTVRADDEGEPFVLLPVQQAFFANHELYPDVVAFSFLRQRIHGPLSAALLLEALLVLEARHPLLRARFERPTSSSTVQQRILPVGASLAAWPSWFEVIDGADAEADMDELFANRPFDLRTESPFRVVLARWGTDRADVLLCVHHIVGDAWSVNILAEELWQTYTRLSRGLPPTLPSLASTFRAFATTPDRAASEHDLRWWRDTLRERIAPAALRLPFDGDPKAVTGPRSAVEIELEGRLTQQLREQAAHAGVSVFHLLLASYARCLAAWSDGPTVVVNVAHAGRGARLPDIERIVGCFADTLPIAVDAASPALEVAQRVRAAWLEAQHHSSVSSADLARLLPSHGSVGPRTASPASFSFARFPHAYPDDCPVTIHAAAARTGSAATRLALLVWETDDHLRCSWSFPATLMERTTIERWARDYVHELEHAVDIRPERVPATLTLERIVRQCASTPDAVAVRGDGESLTYGDLHRRSSVLAAHLRAEGDGPVAMLALPGPESAIAILGCMKAGRPWVPLDPDDAPARLRRALLSTDTRVVVCQTATLATAQTLAALSPLQVVCINALPDRTDVPRDYAVTAPHHIAYIIFTSGSTGTPKAVPITHAALANYLAWITDTFDYGPSDRVLQTAPLCFDASISQMLAPLTVGASVVPVPTERLRDPHALLAFVIEQRPTIWRSVPSLWERVLRIIERRRADGHEPPALDTLRWISVGGEALGASLVRRWMDVYGSAQGIANHYGPTEATINATCYIVPGRPDADDEYVPIGTPVRGTRTMVCDDDGAPVAPGTVGELLLAGVGLTPGYLHDPEQTRARFRDHDGLRWYRTGDLVRERPDGQLMFHGRVDHQIKLRGFRIEPGEIEAALHRHPAIGQAVVVAHPATDGTHELVAFIEPRADVGADADVRRWLRAELPPYMIPHRFEIVAAFPTVGSGKVDRRALAASLTTTAPQATVQSNTAWTPTERVLAAVWADVLHTAPNSRDDDFFEQGGDSLRALDVFARLDGQFARLPRAASVYQHRTLGALASAIDAEQAAVVAPVVAAPSTTFRVTPAQAGFLLAAVLAPDAPSNWCAQIEIDGPFDLRAFTDAIQILVERHAMLRVIFPAGKHPPEQRVLDALGPLTVHYDDLSGLADDPAAQQRRLDDLWQRERAHRFATDRWPLVRMRVCRLHAERHVWLATAPHVIGDGLSVALFGQELFAAYDRLVVGKEPTLPPLPSTFRDYVALLEHEQTSTSTARAQYWRDTFARPYTPPTGWRTANDNGAPHPDERMLVAGSALAPAVVAALKEKASRDGVTLYVLLLTAFLRQLRQLTDADDLVVGTAVSGRDHPLPGILRIFGCFATALPLRWSGNDHERTAQIQEVGALLAAAQQHELAPQQIARLVAGGAPLASIVGAQFFFTFMDFGMLGPTESETLRLRWDASRSLLDPPVGTDLLLAARIVDSELRLTCQGAASAFSQERLDRFARDLVADIQMFTNLHAQPPIRTSIAPTSHVSFVNGDLRAHDTRLVDAALVGYLPPWRDFAGQLGHVADTPALRDQVRQMLFPAGAPRCIEINETRLGRSGFVSIPWFADELVPAASGRLHADIAAAIRSAQEWGARSVSLAGMLPSLTGYGFDLVRQPDGDDGPRLTTGHALTVVSVVMTIEKALRAVGRALGDADVAVVGLGSIGRASLELLLWRGPHPRSIVLCDRAGSAARLAELVRHLWQSTGYRGSIRCVEAEPGSGHAPDTVYSANLIVGATSTPHALDVERLRRGTVVVDDSFPHCFDAAAAIRRMRDRADVLIVGGGLLDCGATERVIAVPPVSAAIRERIAQRLPDQTMASCQLESLLLAADPSLPLVRGLVDVAAAKRYWTAATSAGVQAGPLHVQDFAPDEHVLRRLRELSGRE